ncbi:HesB/YadR/YfhF family protein [Paenibacillus humicola]|uniref:HesB/YadR/YfhF family protein n=1 Tax=Paenibacillus humicola TaxID=3110540 RepID=UPI00237A7574|nr:HesB/YadR/YfhF family protein [Paenibacillus humicola]
MKIVVAQPAARWYKQEMELCEGDSLRFFVRLGGHGSVQPGFSLGVMKDTPRSPALKQVVEGILFYIEEDNVWYLEEKELHVHYDESFEDIRYELV